MRIRRFFGSIRFRTMAIFLAVMILAFVAISSIVFNIVENFQVAERTGSQQESTFRLASELALVLSEKDPGVLSDALYETVSRQAQELGGRALLLDINAVVQMDSASLYNGYRFPCREVRDILVGGEQESMGFHNLEEVNELGTTALFNVSKDWTVYYAAPVIAESELLGVALFSSSIQSVKDSVETVGRRIGITFLLFAFLVGIISLLVAQWLTRPIITLTNAIERVGTQGYSQRVPVSGKGEMAELSEAFNIMSEKLENHERLRDDFISNASHELKTPLSTMKILAESMLYQESVDPDMSREFMQDINHEVDRLTHIINDLLRLVQEEHIENGLELAPVQLDELVQRVINRLMPLAKRKNIRLERKLISVRLDADEARLEQVISNIIDNAIKYTDKGSVAVTLKPDGANAILSVRDTGIGITKEAIPRLFERFYRVDKARSRDTGGTGLGLSIVERIVSQHNGIIHVDSAVGRGTTFTVRLPLSQPTGKEEAHA